MVDWTYPARSAGKLASSMREDTLWVPVRLRGKRVTDVEKHHRSAYCWACLPDKYVAGFEPVPDAMEFLASSPVFACPFLSGDEPDDGRMFKPAHVFGPLEVNR